MNLDFASNYHVLLDIVQERRGINELDDMINRGVELYDKDNIISDEHISFKIRNVGIMEILLRNGYPLHLKNIRLETLYTYCIRAHGPQMIKCLLRNGQRIDEYMTGPNENKRLSALHFTIKMTK